MIFHNPSGAPELACEHCGCRWFDRITGTCYECGTAVPAEAVAEYVQALPDFAAGQAVQPGERDGRAEAGNR